MSDENRGAGAGATESLEAARAALARGQAAEAAALLRDLVAQDPGRADAREMLGAALCQAGEVEAGTAVLAGVVDEHPTSAPAHLNLASALRQAGRRVDAHHHLDIALRLDPHYQRALQAQQAWSSDFAAPDEPADASPASQAEATEAPAAETPTPEAPAPDAASDEVAPLSVEAPSSVGDAPGTDLGDATTVISTPPTAPTAPGAPVGAALGGPVPPGAAVLGSTVLPGATPGSPAPVAALASADLPALPPGSAPAAGAASASGVTAEGQTQKDQEPKPGEIVPEWLANPDPASPDLWSILPGMLKAPADTLTTLWPAFVASPAASAQLAALFLVAAVLWSAAQVFDPGAGGGISAGIRTLDMVVGILAVAVLLVVQTGVFALGISLFDRLPFSGEWRRLFPAFVLAWALPAIPLLVVSLLVSALVSSSGLYFLALAALVAFVLNMIVVHTFYRRGFGRLFVLMLAAQLLGDGIAAAIMIGVSQLR